jgi:hypothetical protein
MVKGPGPISAVTSENNLPSALDKVQLRSKTLKRVASFVVVSQEAAAAVAIIPSTINRVTPAH